MGALIVDPALQASVIRQFNLKGELAPFNLTENVVPVFDIGNLVRTVDPTVITTLAGSQGVRIGTSSQTATIPTHAARLAPGDITDGGFTVNPGAGAVIADSGQLTGADHEVNVYVNGNAIFDVIIEWRDSANAANQAAMSLLMGGVGVGNFVHVGPLVFQIATNERVRVVTGGAVVGTVSASITHNAVFPSLADQ